MAEPHKRVCLDDRIQRAVRFGRELLRQIDSVRRVRGQTFQAFVQAAVVKAIADAEDEADRAKQRRAQRAPARAPKGLFARERLQQVDEPIDAPPAPPAPVIVTVGAAPQRGGDLTTLAKMIVGSPRAARASLLQNACETLAAKARSTDEALSLAEQLDVEIARLDGPTTALARVRARRKK
jgi:hypothetical protein